MTVSIDAMEPLEAQNGTNLPTPDDATYERWEATLLDKSEDGPVPLHQRFRVLFTLKTFANERSIDIIAKAFSDPSALFKHELAYVLGQMKNEYAIPHLTKVLEDLNEEPMVRHEAAEAMGAIGKPTAIPILQKYLSDSNRSVRETCELAIARIEYEVKRIESGEEAPKSQWTSIDPAPPKTDATLSVEELGRILMDTSLTLFERYRAMFSLRDIGTEAAVLELAKGFEDDSALFRHEIAYVFGQLQHPASVPSMIKVLSNTDEAAMVRHECAEALGSIATPECFPVLKKFSTDSERVVRESCVVGLDMFKYETDENQFQYADGLSVAVATS
ncbi:hypothetical protein HK102_011708 [Quaeritorhiza haematococci]|nr:hypothetical protein HK102_011708 [Quaeritorhiza haematococci]